MKRPCAYRVRLSALASCLLTAILCTAAGAADRLPLAPPSLDGCNIYPADNIWNVPVDQLPLDPMSGTYINSIGAGSTLHPDFGSGFWPPDDPTAPIGIPFISVPGTTTPVDINFIWYGDESDPGPYPIPLDAPIEGGPNSTGDRHVLGVDHDNCKLYELYYATPNGAQWDAGSGAVYDLTVNGPLRTDGWTSADAAGLPLFPGLVRFEEVNAGAINHAIRFTAPHSQNKHIWPARHDAGSANTSYPPMGARLRLRANYDISGYSTAVQVILQALKTYGMILADNGSPWYLSGAPNVNWDNNVLHEMSDVPGSAFEVVDTSVLMIDPDSGQARSWPPPPLFSDDFEDNDVSNWSHINGTWLPGSGRLNGTFNKKSDAFPMAFTAGCSNCIIEAVMRIDTAGARASVLGWYLDKQHYVELRLMDDKNKVLLKQISGSSAAKKSASISITPGVDYHVRVRYSNGKITAEVPGIQPIYVNAIGTPSGIVGFRVKSTTGSPVTCSFDSILVY